MINLYIDCGKVRLRRVEDKMTLEGLRYNPVEDAGWEADAARHDGRDVSRGSGGDDWGEKNYWSSRGLSHPIADSARSLGRGLLNAGKFAGECVKVLAFSAYLLADYALGGPVRDFSEDDASRDDIPDFTPELNSCQQDSPSYSESGLLDVARKH